MAIQCDVSLDVTNLSIRAGEDQTIPLAFTENNAVVNITGAKVHLVVKRRLSSSTKVLDVEQTSHTEPTQGRTNVSITRQQSLAMSGRYYYAIELEQSTGIQTVIARGFLFVENVTTKDE